MNPQLDKLIGEFRAAQDFVVKALIEELDLPRPKSNLEWWSICVQRGLTEQTTINDIGFYGHGFGVEVTVGDIECDFDWGPNGEADGFDAWRLFRFSESEEKKSISYELIGMWLEESHAEGELEFDGTLYYDPKRRAM
jgi:hypothetical protein